MLDRRGSLRDGGSALNLLLVPFSTRFPRAH